MQQMEIQFDSPARRWGEALPVGNGHLGGMVYSGMLEERIDLSENTFFSGEKSEQNNQPCAGKAFIKMREQVINEAYQEAEETAGSFIGIRNNYGTNLPVGTLRTAFKGFREENIYNYQRKLNIETGIVSSTYVYESKAAKKVLIERETFASHVHNVLVYSIKAADPVLNISISFEGANNGSFIKAEEAEVHFTCSACETIHSDGESGTMLCGTVAVETDGFVKADSNKETLSIEQAAYVRLYVKMETDFGRESRDRSENLFAIKNMLKNQLQKLRKLPFENIREMHMQDIKGLLGRVDLHIEGNQKEKAVSDIPFLFQYGRYLLCSSSREDSKLPAHLQGIWNDSVACRIGWSCDMHLDINTQMNYWPAEVTNLSEVTESLFNWIEDLAVAGQQSAKDNYGLEGWVAEIVSNAWGFSAPYWAMPISPCPTGGVWILTHMWEHFQYTQDREFLRKRCYPLLQGAARFFADYVFEDRKTGYMSCGPSISPENSFLADGRIHYLSNGCTYEISMIRELFTIYRMASEELHLESALLEKIKKIAPALIPYRITKNGCIAEWTHDYTETDSQHRHTSHLLGVFPFAQITPEEKQLAEATEKSIDRKMTPKEQWEDTGWARSMLMLYEARLWHPKKAYEHIRAMLEQLLEVNYMVIHPPTRGAGSFANVYELDGNTGLTACIAEMLLQSHRGMIRLLPALPAEWESGRVSGLKARGNIETAIEWEYNKLKRAVLKSSADTKCIVVYENCECEVVLTKNQPREVLFNEN